MRRKKKIVWNKDELISLQYFLFIIPNIVFVLKRIYGGPLILKYTLVRALINYFHNPHPAFQKFEKMPIWPDPSSTLDTRNFLTKFFQVSNHQVIGLNRRVWRCEILFILIYFIHRRYKEKRKLVSENFSLACFFMLFCFLAVRAKILLKELNHTSEIIERHSTLEIVLCYWVKMGLGYWTCDFVEAGPIESLPLVSWLVS